MARSIGLAVSMAWRADPWRATGAGLGTISLALAGPAVALGVRYIVNRSIVHDVRGATTGAAVIGLVTLALMLVAWSGFALRQTVGDKTLFAFDRRLIEVLGEVPDVEHHERPDLLDKIELLRQGRWGLRSSIDAVVNTAYVLLHVVLTAVVLGRVSPWLLLLPAFALPSLWTAARAEGLTQRHLDAHAESFRRGDHFFMLATAAAPAAEVRVFGLAPEFRRRFRAVWASPIADRDRVNIKRNALSTAGWLVFGLAFVGALALVGHRVATGHATVGDLVLTMTLAGEVNGQVLQMVAITSWLFSSLKHVDRYIDLVNHARAHTPSGPFAAPPDQLADGIRFHDVSFSYPGVDTAVLHDVDLHLPAGTTVAIVGDNGAGKSTLVKLLCRFYAPSAGRITVDGLDLADLDPVAWRERLSAGFQDFAKLELLARETVGVGRVEAVDDAPAVLAALDRASAADVLAALPDGLETQVGRLFDDGLELSGGQWQKLALGRAMMRPSPLVLVLDEPTASLDAETEHALFERYAGAARATAMATGGITVLVSHRFSTVRMADVILVVADGRVAEVGNHDDLVSRGGLYAELYSLQARAYR